MKEVDKGEEYISAFPQFRKWINECWCCHRKGYKPEMPEHIGNPNSFGSYFIRKHFKPLSLNKDGLCEICEKLIKY